MEKGIIENNNDNRIIPILLIVILVIFAFLPLYKSFDQDKEFLTNDNLMKAKSTFKRLIDSSNYKQLGFTSEKQIDSLVIGTKYVKYFIEVEKIINYNGTDSIPLLLSRESSVEVSLLDKTNKIVNAIEFKKDKQGKWKAAGYGSSSLFNAMRFDTTYKNKGEIFLVDVPAMNKGFYIYRDTTSKNWKGRLFNSGYLFIDAIPLDETPDILILNELKKQAQKIDFRYPG
ncbi:MAG: hypothetical protein HOP11_14400 [Saprospiraceae bacterium]|nr:hypothetical protein [Saprospiraceae bacterium]